MTSNFPPTSPDTTSTHASPAEVTGRAVVTRFAPSPTGYLHIGGARTALFNWLYARQAGGKFLLRIEDTDRARSTPAATQAILEGLSWLGLNYDGEAVLQFSRADRHREAALALIESGGAYRCYLTAEEEATLKDQERAAGRAFRSPWRDEGYGTPPVDAPFVTRLRAPSQNASIVVADKVLGDVVTGGREIDDFILLRTDLSPTYMLAVVVDDHDMGVTHVIRGDDHLTNAARQTALINAFGWHVPVYAHIPLIHGEDGKKLSKRHGALGVEDYRDMGYLPEAMCAYLLRLGWSKGDLDIVSSQEALALFDLDGIGKSPSRLDFAKMDSVNAHFLRLADDERLAKLVVQIASDRGYDVDPQTTTQLTAAMGFLKDRAKTLLDLTDQCVFFLARRPLVFDEKSTNSLTPEARERIGRAREALAQIEIWRHESIKDAIAAFATSEGVGFGKVGPILRSALTGGKTAPDLGVTMEILGRDETLARLSDVL
jgi:glutamyl-tRNA synthetase